MGLTGEISACSLPTRKRVQLPITLKAINPEIAIFDERVYQAVRSTPQSVEVAKPNSS
jgi:hypothetical protein